MKRHIIRKHGPPQCFLPCFPNRAEDNQTRFKIQKSNHHSLVSDGQLPTMALNWPLYFFQDASDQKTPSWLESLRTVAEISKSMREIRQNQTLQPSVNPLTPYINGIKMQEPQFKNEDFVVVGYAPFACDKCLIIHPLTLYWHTQSMKVVSTIHALGTGR
jgi:hypothetical protein